jgi:hypothetical protein
MTKEEFRHRVIELELGNLNVMVFNQRLYDLVREYLRSD